MKFSDKELDIILEVIESYGYEDIMLEHTIIMTKRCDKIADKIHKYFNSQINDRMKWKA